jgi:hypothetical protein
VILARVEAEADKDPEKIHETETGCRPSVNQVRDEPIPASHRRGSRRRRGSSSPVRGYWQALSL